MKSLEMAKYIRIIILVQPFLFTNFLRIVHANFGIIRKNMTIFKHHPLKCGISSLKLSNFQRALYSKKTTENICDTNSLVYWMDDHKPRLCCMHCKYIHWKYNETPNIHCKYLNARSECNDIVISVYSHYPLNSNAKSFDTKCVTLSIRWFCIRNERVMTVYGNYDVIAFRSCIHIFTV